MPETTRLLQWVEEVKSTLALDDTPFDREAVHILLDLARDAAHGVMRPASPLTCYLVGVAVGRGQSLGRAAARVTELAGQQQDESPADDTD